MALDVHILPLSSLPALRWQWDTETDILSGSFTVPEPQAGYNGSVELNDEEGSVAVVDVNGGMLCGLDLVVWPDVVVLPGLASPVEARTGMVVVPSRTARRGAGALEFDTTLSISSDPSERIYHLRIGTRRPVEPVRVADKLLVEVDAGQRLAGFWLEAVPAPPDPG
jgi:hypothetical protein